MGWSVIDRKVTGVRSRLNDWELQSLEREFIESTNRVFGSRYQARSVRGVLFLDLAYALSLHRDWLQMPVLSVLLVEFLQLDHGVSRNDAEIIVHDMVDAAIQLGLGRLRGNFVADRDFLTWAYVCAATASDETALEADLGLGTAVLNKLRDGIKALEQVDNNIFVSEYDAMLAAIVIELSHETKSVPWSMDFERIKFALLSAGGDAAQPYILPESLPVILDALVAIGLGERHALIERPALAELLVQAGLLMESKNDQRRKKQGHTITDLGARVTAAKVGLATGPDFSLDEFFKYNTRWQQFIVKRAKAISFDFLVTLATQGINKLSPEVLEAIICRMCEIDQSRIKGDLVKKILGASQMGWHKAAIIRALRVGSPTKDLLEVVAEELTSTATPGVRMAASALIEAWTD